MSNGKIDMRSNRIRWAAVAAASVAVAALLTVGLRSALAAPTANGRIVYSINTTTPQARAYTVGSPGTFGTAAATVAGAIPSFMVDRAAPTRNEHVAGYVTTAGQLYVMRWNGTAWSNEWNVAVGGDGVNGRRFDIAYENTSGNAVVVYSTSLTGSNEMAYRSWNGTTWTAAANINATFLQDQAAWIKLLPRPGSNEIALTVADRGGTGTNSAYLTTLIWSGTAWGNEPSAAHTQTYISSGSTQLLQNDLFDMAYESTSGNLWVFWTDATNQMRRTFSGTPTRSWQTSATFGGTARTAPMQMVAASDPNSNNVVVAWNRSASANVYAYTWAGGVWSASSTVGLNGQTTANNKKTIAAQWLVVGGTSYPVVMWGTSTAGTIGYNQATVSGTTVTWVATPYSQAFSGATFGTWAWMDTIVDPRSPDTLMLAFSDSNSDLFARQLVLTSGPTLTWTADSSAALTTTLPNTTAQCFDFAYDRATATPPGTPGTPTFSATTTTATTVAWTAATGATSYNLQRATDSGFTTNLTTVTGAANPYTDSTLTAGTTYWYRVVAVNGAGSTTGTGASITTLPGAPGTPTFSGTTATATTVTWTAGTGATSYNVQRASDSGFTTNLTTFTGVTSPYTDSTLSASTTYWYRAVAVNGTGTTNGAGASVTTLSLPGAPGTPTFSGTTYTATTVAWTAGTGATSYNVQRASDSGFTTNLTTFTGVTSPYTDSTLSAGTTYWYRAVSVNAGGSTNGLGASVSTLPLPGVPGTPTFSGTTGTATTVTWTAATNATSYNLQRASDSAFTTNLTTFTGATSPYTDSTLVGTTTYWYRAVAVNPGGSTNGAGASVTTLAGPPAAPAAPTYASVAQTTLTVNWTAASGATTYNVQRSTDNATWTTLTTGLAVLTYNATGLTAGTLYYFRIQAVNAQGTTSGVSSSVTTLAAPPGAPGTPTFSNIAAGSATVTWTAATGATSYNLQRATDSAFTLNLTTFTGVASPYSDTTLAGNTTYYYRVVAVNSGGSTTGASGSMTTLAAPVLTVAAGTMPAAANVAAGTSGTAIGQLSLTATSTGATLTTLSIQNLGTAVNDTEVSSLGLYNGTTFVASSVWDPTTSRYDFNGLSIAVSTTATVLNVKLNLTNAAAVGKTFQMRVTAPADLAVVLPSSIATSTTSGNIFTVTAGSTEGSPASGGPAVSVLNPLKGSVVTLAPAGNPAGVGFKVQVRVYNAAGISGITANSVVVSTDNFATTTVATQNANYNTGSPVTGAVYDAIINPAAGQYTLVARAANATATITSAGVPITVVAAGTGDGNLLVRDNSSQLCGDCHAVKSHGAEATSSKYGSWSTTCRDCHTPHSTRNVFLVNESITPPAVAGVQPAKQVGFVKTTGDSNAAGLAGSAPAATASFVNSDASGPCQVCHTRTASTGKTGTASFTSGSGTVTASAAVFASTDVNRSLLGPDGKAYAISAYTSTTVVTITPVYAGTTNAAGSFVVGDKRWRNTGNSDTHYTSAAGTQACTNCHAHTGGFAASCTGCHGNSTRTTFAVETPPVDSCGNTTSGTSIVGGTLNRVGAHQAHLLGNSTAPISSGVTCSQCHLDPPNRAGHPDNTKCTTSNTANRAVFTWGNLANGTKYGWSPTVTPTYNYSTQGCTNYCHGNFTNGNTTNTPTWNSTVACGSCHGASPTAPQPLGSHPVLTTGTTCQSCHGGTYNCTVGTACTAAGIDKTRHINGKVEADCTGCHGSAIAANASLKFPAGRRAIVPEFTNTAGWSHKRSGGFAVTKWDCIVCHMEGDPTTGDRSAVHGDGVINLRDPDTGNNITAVTFTAAGGASPGSYNTSSTTPVTFAQFSRNLTTTLEADANAATLQAIMVNQCLKCHDSNGALAFGAGLPLNPLIAQNALYSAAKPFATTIAGAGYSTTTYYAGSTLVGVTAGGVAGGVTDINASLATTNSAYHPVLGKGNNWYAKLTRMKTPWNTATRGATVDTTSWGPLLSCWDCHANSADTGTITYTVTAHGTSVGKSQLRGTATTSGTPSAATAVTLCVICHAQYDTTTGDYHGTNSAWSTNVNQGFQSAPQYACNVCHSSGYAAAVPRPVRAMDVHGVNTLMPNGFYGANTYTITASSRWATAGTPIAFIRNREILANHQPAKVGGTSYVPQCDMSNNGVSFCGSQGTGKTYSVGGTY